MRLLRIAPGSKSDDELQFLSLSQFSFSFFIVLKIKLFTNLTHFFVNFNNFLIRFHMIGCENIAISPEQPIPTTDRLGALGAVGLLKLFGAKTFDFQQIIGIIKP